MDLTNNANKPSLQKSRSNASFSQAAVTKSDVGDFQEGYFVMADMPSTIPQHRTKTHKTPERNNQRKSEHSNNRQPNYPRERSTKDTNVLVQQREGDLNVSNVRITSPTRSPTRTKRTSPPHSPQRHQTTYGDPSSSTVTPISPNKPRKAHSHPHMDNSPSSLSLESGSPPRDKGPSPPPNRWAGPAFSNAPPPSSLPLPDFPPFLPSSPQLSAAASPPTPTRAQPIPIPVMYQPPQYIHQALQTPVYAPMAYGYPLHLAYEASQPTTLVQLSTDLRRMLHISAEQPILA